MPAPLFIFHDGGWGNRARKKILFGAKDVIAELKEFERKALVKQKRHLKGNPARAKLHGAAAEALHHVVARLQSSSYVIVEKESSNV